MKNSLYISVLALFFGCLTTLNAQGLISHDFNDGDMGPFVDCTTQSPNYAKVVNNRLRTYWQESSYTTNRMTKGAEACGDPVHNGIGYLTYKHCWMGFTMNIDQAYMGPSYEGIGGLAQIFGFDDARGQFSWSAMLDIEDGNLTWVDRRGIGSSRADVVVYEDFPRGEDVNIIIHAVLSDNNTGLVELFVNDKLEYSAYNIRIGMGEFDDNDVQTNQSYTEFKIGQYNHSGAAENEIRIVDYDNISWYDGEDGYDIVNPDDDVTTPTPTPIVNFVPDPNKTYYIDAPYHNVRLAATGESEDPYTTSTNIIGDDVEWKFVAKGNGAWHIQLAAGGSKPRLRTDNSEDADMQPTTSSGTWTYYTLTEGALDNTYFLTLNDAPDNYKRLQIDRDLKVKMVEDTRDGTWESFTFTEAGYISGAPIKLEAESNDGDNGVQAENTTDANGGQNIGWINDGDWLRFDDINLSGLSNMDARIACNFTGGTIEVRTGSASGTLLGSISITNTGGNQKWITKSTSISNTSGTQDIYLVFKGGSGYLFNVNWVEFNTNSSANKDVIASAEVTQIRIYPNPAVSTATIVNAANAALNVYDLNGSLLLSQFISSESEILDLSLLAPGVYYAEVNNGKEITILKLVKL